MELYTPRLAYLLEGNGKGKERERLRAPPVYTIGTDHGKEREQWQWVSRRVRENPSRYEEPEPNPFKTMTRLIGVVRAK